MLPRPSPDAARSACADGPAAASAAASATEPTPVSASTRSECVSTRSPASARFDSGTMTTRTPSFSAAARMPASALFASMVAITSSASAVICARASAARIAASMSGADVPRLHPMPATIMVSSRLWSNPLRHRHCRPPAGLFADRAGARDRDADQFAAERRMAGEQQRLGFERHRIDDEPAAGPQRRNRRVEHARIAGAAADEDGVRRRQARERRRRRALDNFEPGHAERGGVAANARRAIGALFDRDRAHEAGRPASIRSRPSRSRRRYPTTARRAAAPATTASPRAFRAW